VREIKFRGKRINDKEWVEGFVSVHTICGEKTYLATVINVKPQKIYDVESHEVDPATVGQYTGLKDKNGVKIYEGDIVSGTALSRNRTGVIVWIDELAGFGVRYAERNDPTAWQESSILKNIATHNYSNFCAVVIGNIHDNPDLLEGGKADAD
jgi:uncharacterized phage protein (TIGR01671 family)